MSSQRHTHCSSQWQIYFLNFLFIIERMGVLRQSQTKTFVSTPQLSTVVPVEIVAFPHFCILLFAIKVTLARLLKYSLIHGSMLKNCVWSCKRSTQSPAEDSVRKKSVNLFLVLEEKSSHATQLFYSNMILLSEYVFIFNVERRGLLGCELIDQICKLCVCREHLCSFIFVEAVKETTLHSLYTQHCSHCRPSHAASLFEET